MQSQSTSSKAQNPFARLTHYRWYIALVLLLLFSLGQFDKLGISLLFVNHSFQQTFGLVNKPAQAGLLMTSFLIAYGISIFFWGLLGNRIGLRKAVIIGLTGWALCILWFSLSSGFTAAIWSRIALGLAEGFLWPISNALTAVWFPVSERARAQSIWINGVNIGPVVGFALLGGLLTGSAWRSAFYLIVAVTVVIAIPLAWTILRNSPADQPKVNDAERTWIEQGSLEHTAAIPGHEHAQVTATLSGSLRNPNAWVVMLAYLGTGFLFWGISTWLPTFLASSRHFSGSAISHWTQFAWILALISMIIVGYYSDRGLKRAVYGMVSMGISVLGLIAAAFSGSPVEGAIVIGIALAGSNVGTMIGQNLIHSLIVAKGMAEGSGWILGITNIITAFTPVIIGWILSLGNHSFVAPFLFLAVMGAMSAVCGLILARRGY